MRNLILCFLLFNILGNFAAAQITEEENVSYGKPIAFSDEPGQSGWAGYVAANAGYTEHNTDRDVEGAPTSIKLIGSYVLPNSTAVFDLGYGVQNQSFSQKAALESNIATGVVELAARFQFESRWQIGGVFNQIFNKGEIYGANQADAQFTGIQVLREFSFGKNFLGRVGGRVMTSINVNSESVNMGMIDFQIGWGGVNPTILD